MDIVLKTEWSSFIMIVRTMNFIVFSTRLACSCLSTFVLTRWCIYYFQGRHSEKWRGREEQWEGEKRVQALEGSISTHRSRCRLHLQQLQQDLPSQDKTAKPYQGIQLCKRLTISHIPLSSETDRHQNLHLICIVYFSFRANLINKWVN